MKRLHPGARWVFRVRGYFTPFFIAVILAISFRRVVDVGTNFIIGLALLIILGEIYARLAYDNWKYKFTSTELKTEKGIIWKRYISIPYQRVQNVEIRRGILARIFNFSSLDIHTAGYSGVYRRGFGGTMAEGHIPAVSVEDAEKIRESLIKKIGKRSGL